MMNFDQLALIPAAPSVRLQLAEGIARIEREFGPAARLGQWQLYAFESLSSTMDIVPFLLSEEARARTTPRPPAGAFARTLRQASVHSEHAETTTLPVAVIALDQHRARGREGRAWMSTPQGGLYVTFLLRPEIPPQRILGYSLGIGLAVQKFLDSHGVSSGLKWPNDVLVRDPRIGSLKKIAGILVEMSGSSERITSLSVGIGLNLNQTQFPPEVPGISMRQALGKPFEIVPCFALLMHYVSEMLARLESEGFAAMVDEYNNRSLANGAVVRIYHHDRLTDARVVAVAPDGGLRVAVGPEGIEQLVYSGELEIDGYTAPRPMSQPASGQSLSRRNDSSRGAD